MTFEIECPQCGLHISADHADAGMEGVCPGCNAGIVVPDPSFEDATSGSEMNGETHAFTEEPPPIPASAVSGHGAATHAFPHEAVAHGAPTVPLGTLKSILPLVLLIALLGWVPLLAMHGGRLVQASSGATFILTGLCASFAAAALSYRWLRPRGISGLAALLVFLSTAVAGVSLLLAFQWCAEFTLKHGPVYAGKATVWIWIIQFAGKCYAWSGSADFFKQTVGCVFGIGVYEELTKILPLAVVLFTGYGKPLAGRINYRAFVALGFLSGLAFGISEALVVYAPWAQTLQIDDSGVRVLGTPITSGLNRWFSCVPMHALWGAADAAVLWLLSTRLLSAKSPLAKFGILILATMSMAVVHGLYDAACFRGSYAGIVLGIGSVFLVQWIVAHSAASSDPVPPNSSGCERPLEALFRLPYAIALTSAIALFGFGALYWVSIPLSSGSPLIGSEQNLSPLDREALALADSEFAKVLMTSDDSWFAYDTERSRYVEIKGLKLDVKPRELSEANVLNGIEWVGDVSGTYRVQRVLSISGVQLEWDEWTGAGSLSVVHCEKVRGRWHTEASDLKRLSVLRRHSVFASAKDVTVAEALASLLPKKLGDKLRADIEKLRADIETVRQAKIANLLEQARRWLTSEQELPGIYESVLKLNSQYDSARSDYQSVLKLDSNNAAAKAGLLEADKAEAEFVKRGVEISRKIRAATKEVPWVNSLGMMFVPVPIAGRPADGVKVLFSVWNTREQDYNASYNLNNASRASGSVDEGATHSSLVNLENAHEFCERLTLFERGRGIIGATERYTLPSDHWWSCAAGIGDREDPDASPKDKSGKITDVHPWGRGWPPPKDARNYVNEYGLHDLVGRARQWCDTLYDPRNARDQLMSTSFWKDDAFVLRGGGSYSESQADKTLSSRDYKNRLSHEGFRCVLVSRVDSPR